MKKRFTLFAMCVISFMTSSLSAQISNYFSSESDLTGFKGAQSDLSIENQKLKMQITGGWWGVASYEPESGIDWDFDKYKIVALRVGNKTQGTIQFKFYDGTDTPFVNGRDDESIPVDDGSGDLIYVFDLEQLSCNGNLIGYTGVQHLVNCQIAFESVGPENTFYFDWIESFSDIDSAYEFIGKVLEGWDPTPTGIESVSGKTIQVNGEYNSISFKNMEKQEEVTVYDSTGKKVCQTVIFNTEIPNLAQGIYIVKTGSQINKVCVK